MTAQGNNLHDAAIPRSLHDAAKQLRTRRSPVVINKTLLERLRSFLNGRTGRNLLDRCRKR